MYGWVLVDVSWDDTVSPARETLDPTHLYYNVTQFYLHYRWQPIA
jgi:hypothetical protein